MKRINNLILALAGLFAVACADTFEERYDLAVNTDRYSVTAEAGKLPVTVYCSGAWTAQLTAESAWATLDRTAGSGITTIRLNYADNPGLTRSVGVVLRGSGLEKTVTVVQKAGITAPELIFLSKDLAFANGAYKGTAAFETNLPDELLRDVVPAVTYAAEGDAWISDVVYHADDEEAGETEIPLARRGLITFATAANATGEPRTATVGFSVTDADGNVFGDSFTVTQSADEARITLADDVAPIEGGRRAVAFSTNLGALLAEMKVEVTYADPAVADFISDVELGAGELTYAITANEGVEKRYATITVSCADLAGGVVSASSNITQRVTAQPREVSFADLRALFTAEDKSYASDEDHIDYLLCRVIGDAGNPNMDQNLNTGPNSITTDENDCTNYVQSLDGRYGFRLKFAAPADNVCLRGEQVKILLDGVTLSRESDPMRYTLRGLKAGNIEKAAEASALEPKARTIATLTDDDIYTYCALSGLEFSVKEGAYTNVREYDAIATLQCEPLVRRRHAGPEGQGRRGQSALRRGQRRDLHAREHELRLAPHGTERAAGRRHGQRHRGPHADGTLGRQRGPLFDPALRRGGHRHPARRGVGLCDARRVAAGQGRDFGRRLQVERQRNLHGRLGGQFGHAARPEPDARHDRQHGRRGAALQREPHAQSDGYRRPFVPHRHRPRLPRAERLELRAGRRHDDGHVEIHDAGLPRQRCPAGTSGTAIHGPVRPTAS